MSLSMLTRGVGVFVALVALAAACSSTGDSDSASEPAPAQSLEQAPASEQPPADEARVAGALPAEAVLCEDIAPAPGTGALAPTGTAAEFSAARQALQGHLGESVFSMGAGGTSSHVGRITLGLRTRDPAVVQSLLDLVEPRLVCFELPPVDFDGETPVPAIWTVAGNPGPDATSVRLLVDDPTRECGHDPQGRVLPPVVEESETEVRITIELTAVPWGAHNCAGWGPTPVVVELAGPLGSRDIVGSS